MTKTERLLKKMKARKTGMSHQEVVQFLLDLRHGKGMKTYDSSKHSNYWSRNLYGTRDTLGIYERFCRKDKTTGRYHVVRKITAPFTTSQTQLNA